MQYGGDWKFLDDGLNATTSGWAEPQFDDSGWPTGQARCRQHLRTAITASLALKTLTWRPAPSLLPFSFLLLQGQFGFGDGDESTEVRAVTTVYFRKAVTVPASGPLEVAMIFDDGAVVYVNGVEVFRINLGDGDVVSDADYS